MALTVGCTRVTAHPLALLFPLAAAMLGAGDDALALAVGLFFHEGAHVLAARCLGVGISRLRLMPFGAAIAMDNPYALAPSRLFAVAAAGPLGSALTVLAAGAFVHWGALSPTLGAALLRVNGALLAFNLLPALPLDGGRMLYAALQGRLGRARAAETGIWLGRAVAAALLMLALCGAIARGRLNLSPVLAAVFLIASGGDERRALTDARAQAMLGALKPFGKPVPARLWAVSADRPLADALRVARPDAVTLYAVYKDGRLSSITDDRRLMNAALEGGPGLSIGEGMMQ